MTGRPLPWMTLIGLVAMFSMGGRGDTPTVDVGDRTVESFEEIDFTRFQESVSRAVTDGAPWVEDPLQITLAFVGPF